MENTAHIVNKKRNEQGKDLRLTKVFVGLIFFWSFFSLEHNLYRLQKLSESFVRLNVTYYSRQLFFHEKRCRVQ